MKVFRDVDKIFRVLVNLKTFFANCQKKLGLSIFLFLNDYTKITISSKLKKTFCHEFRFLMFKVYGSPLIKNVWIT